MEHINCSSLHLPAIVHGGDQYFVQEDLLSHEYLSQDLLSHEPTLWFRRH